MTATGPRKARACPICGDQPEAPFAPFCSKRCADVDLGRWFSESYRVPGPSAEDDGRSEADGEG